MSREFVGFFFDREARGERPTPLAGGEDNTIEVCDHLSDHAFRALAHRRGAVGADDGEGFLFRFHAPIIPHMGRIANLIEKK